MHTGEASCLFWKQSDTLEGCQILQLFHGVQMVKLFNRLRNLGENIKIEEKKKKETRIRNYKSQTQILWQLSLLGVTTQAEDGKTAASESP